MCRAGKNVWIFGGEDKNRNVLDEVWYFDTETCVWCMPEIKGGKKPPALAYHTAVSYQSQYIVVREENRKEGRKRAGDSSKELEEPCRYASCKPAPHIPTYQHNHSPGDEHILAF
eukprot:1329791-Pyramimonas_sp.AAC.1